MKERIRQFLQSENKSSSQFAEEIGVQPSGISHIISGRNNPSLDFIIKMLTHYNYLSTDWLLFGKGTMYKDSKTRGLFDNELYDSNKIMPEGDKDSKQDIKFHIESLNSNIISEESSDVESLKSTEKIVYFYYNGTFREYFPGKK